MLAFSFFLTYIFIADNISISMYIMCVILCLFSALSRRVCALQISIISIIISIVYRRTKGRGNDDYAVTVYRRTKGRGNDDYTVTVYRRTKGRGNDDYAVTVYRRTKGRTRVTDCLANDRKT